jgi:hypothetical protein
MVDCVLRALRIATLSTSHIRHVVLFPVAQGGWGPLGHPKPALVGGQTVSDHAKGQPSFEISTAPTFKRRKRNDRNDIATAACGLKRSSSVRANPPGPASQRRGVGRGFCINWKKSGTPASARRRLRAVFSLALSMRRWPLWLSHSVEQGQPSINRRHRCRCQNVCQDACCRPVNWLNVRMLS